MFIIQKILHARYVLLILHEVRRILKRLVNVNIVSTYHSTCVTVVGDLHGNLPDLMLIFHKVIYRVVLYIYFDRILFRTVYHPMKIHIYLMVILSIEDRIVWKYFF